MPQELERGVIRVINREGKTVGTGFVIDEHLAVTCAHVANAAMEIVPETMIGKIQIQYHYGKSKQVAELVKKATGADDVAFMRLANLPDGVTPLKLGRADRSDGHEYASLGYPKNSTPAANRKPRGRINGVVDAEEVDRRSLLELVGEEFYYGTSGSPVLDLVSDRVVGMITSHKNLEFTKVVYATTADTIQVYWPDQLLEKPLVDLERHNVRDYLKAGLLPSQKNLLSQFLDEYLGDQEEVPFGGRDKELTRLDEWIRDPNGSSYMLLTAPAGRGKTHLVVKWAANLLAQQQVPVEVILIPISIRFATAPPEMHLQMLARSLAKFFKDPIQETAGDTRSVWRNICAEYLMKDHQDRDPLLVVILDGLDESTDSDPDQWRGLIGDLPAGTRVLLSARWLGGEKDESGWRKRLGLKSTRASYLTLPRLKLNGLRQVLESMGNPLRGYAQEWMILRELLRLTAGDPLLVRLYVQDLHDMLSPVQQNSETVSASEIMERLKVADPDLKGYFNGWWQDQRKQWKAQGENADDIEDHLREFLRLLAAAFAPLKGSEIAVLLGEKYLYKHQQTRLAERAPRIIIGSWQTGYTLSHQRFGLYFYEEMDDREQAIIEGYFLEAGQRTLKDLVSGAVKPTESQKYFILHTKDHLIRALKHETAQPKDLYALLSENWLRAHEYHGGTPASFLEDAAAAWEVAARQPSGDPAIQILAALCFSSVATLSSNIPHEVICKCYQVGLLSKAQSLAYLRMSQDIQEKIDGLICLAEIEAKPGEQALLMNEALETSNQMKNKYLRNLLLSKIALHVSRDQALEIVQQIRSSDKRAYALVLAHLAPHLPAEQQSAIINEAIEVAFQLEERDDDRDKNAEQGINFYRPYSRSNSLAELAPLLPLDKALEVALRIENPSSRARALIEITPRLPPDQALEVARQIDVLSARARVLTEITPNLPPEQKPVILNEALDIAHQLKDIPAHDRALADIAPYFPAETALDLARQIPHYSVGYYRPRALARIIPNLPDSQQSTVLQEVFEAIDQIMDDHLHDHALEKIAYNLPTPLVLEVIKHFKDFRFRSRTMARIAPGLPMDQQRDILQKAFEIGRKIDDYSSRIDALMALIPQLAPGQALELAHNIEGNYSLANLLLKIFPHLSESQQPAILQEMLETANRIKSPYFLALTLGKIVRLLPEEQQIDVVNKAIEAAKKIKKEFFSTTSPDDMLVRIASDLPPDMVLEVAKNIGDPFYRVRALAELIPRLPPGNRPAIIRKAIETAGQIELDINRTNALASITPYLPSDKAVKAALLIKNPETRSFTLFQIAQQLPPDQSLEVARLIGNSDLRSRALADIAIRLPPDQALGIARQITTSENRAATLAKIAVNSPLDQQIAIFNEALLAARSINDFHRRIQTIALIAPNLSSSKQAAIFDEAFIRAHEISNHRIQALTLIVPYVQSKYLPRLWEEALSYQSIDMIAELAKRCPDLFTVTGQSCNSIFTQTLKAFRRSKREVLLKLVIALEPLIVQLGGEVALKQTVEAIQSVGRWWP